MWGVPRNARHNPLRARLRSLLLLAAGGGSVIVTTVLSALSAAADSYGAAAVGVSVRAGAAALAVALNVTLFMVAFKILIATPVTVRQIRAGAIAAAVSWQALQLAGAVLLGDKLKGATATYGLFAIVLGLLAWVYVGSVTVVMCAEFNAVRARGMWPRSLLGAVLRQPGPHRRRPARLHLLRQDRTAQELRDHRRQLQLAIAGPVRTRTLKIKINFMIIPNGPCPPRHRPPGHGEGLRAPHRAHDGRPR